MAGQKELELVKEVLGGCKIFQGLSEANVDNRLVNPEQYLSPMGVCVCFVQLRISLTSKFFVVKKPTKYN